MVDRIEVLSGPSSVLFGNGAVGGVVNVISRKPSRNRETMARLSYGSFNTYNAAIDTTGPWTDRLTYRAAVSSIDSEGWVQRGKSSSITWAGQMRFDLSDQLSFTLMSDYGHQKPMNYYGMPLINGEIRRDLRDVNYNIMDARTWFKDLWTRVVADWTPSENFSVKNTVYAMSVKREWFRTDRYTYQPATNNILREGYSDVAHDQKQWGVVGYAAYKSQFGAMENNFSAGYEFSAIDFTHINNNPAAGSTVTNLANTSPGVYTGGALSPFYPRYHSDSTQLAFFAENRLEILPQLSLIGGVRWDRARQDRYDYDLKSLDKARFSPVSYRGGVVWTVFGATNLYAQYSVAHDFFGNLISLSPGTQQTFKLPVGRQVEVGIKQALMDGRLEWTLAAYDIVKNNLPVADPTNPLLTVQVGEQASKGIEATLNLRLTTGFGINLNGSTLDAEFRDYQLRSGATVISYNGNRPTSIPTSSVNAWLYWDVNPDLRLHSGIKYVGDSFVNDLNTQRQKGYTTVDFGLRYQLMEEIVADFLVRNAFDRFYTSGFRANSRTGGGQQIVGPPRQIQLSLTARF